MIAFWAASSSLMPVGYSDGSMLFHLGLRTRSGQVLIHRLILSKLQADAEAYHQRAQFYKRAQVLEQMLELTSKARDENGVGTADCHDALGHTKFLIRDWPGAEREFLEFLKSSAGAQPATTTCLHYRSLLALAHMERYDLVQSAPAYADVLEKLEQTKIGMQGEKLAWIHAIASELHAGNRHFRESLAEAEEGLRVLPGDSRSIALRAELHALAAESYLGLKCEGAAQGSAARAMELARLHGPNRGSQNLAWYTVAALALRFWKEGTAVQALEILEEAITALESGGARDIAAMYRIKLVSMFRELGRLDDADRWIPEQPEMYPVLERQFLEERARLRLVAGDAGSAVADCRALVELWESEPDAAPEKAVAASLLAQALLDFGDYQQAESLARQAADVLTPRQHPETGACLITVALASSKSGETLDAAAVEDALQMIASHPMLSEAEKQRLTEAERHRIDRYGANRVAAEVAG
jgi:tetratricopeptide (TPR) repeat protein